MLGGEAGAIEVERLPSGMAQDVDEESEERVQVFATIEIVSVVVANAKRGFAVGIKNKVPGQEIGADGGWK
jgi:hypothetical protein